MFEQKLIAHCERWILKSPECLNSVHFVITGAIAGDLLHCILTAFNKNTFAVPSPEFPTALVLYCSLSPQKNLSARDDSSAFLQHLAPERIIFRLECSKRSTLSLNGKKKNEIIKILLKLPLISFEKSIKTFLDFHFKGFGFSFPNTLNCFSRFLNLAHSFWNLKVLQGLGKWTSCLKNCFTRKFT